MAEARKADGKHALKVPDFLKEPIEAAQVRLGQLEEEAQRVLRDLMLKGRAGRHDIEQIVHKLARQDWTLPEMKHRLEKLREQGVERAAELKGKAISVRAEALGRMVELQGKVVAFLGVATREQVEELSRELERLAKRIERGQRPRRPGKKGTKPSEQV
jgi:hypothetical protein